VILLIGQAVPASSNCFIAKLIRPVNGAEHADFAMSLFLGKIIGVR
jgi:hypothetical protein